MLANLRIRNLALVDELNLELAPGYNAITGETGAGKSIVIGALKLVLGERADRTLIRSGADSCTVEAVFTLDQSARRVARLLEEKGLEPCEENQLLLKRVFTAAGANRQFVNGSPATLSTLGELGEWLVDMHGPHEHQSLLHEARQLQILDASGGLLEKRSAFAELLEERRALQARKAELIVDERTYAQQLDLLRFQTQEIGKARLTEGEEEVLAAEHARASHAARLIELSQAARAVLGEEEPSVISQLGQVGRSLGEMERLDSEAGTLVRLHQAALESLRDLQQALGQYADKLEVDPARLAELEERLNLVQSLKRKYGATLAEVIAFGEEAERKLRALESRDEELARLAAALAGNEQRLWKAGSELSDARRKFGPKLAKAVMRELEELAFPQSRLEVSLATPKREEVLAGAVSASGFDRVEFLFAPNPGEPPRPLRAIASSGELARVMLALKTVLAEQDEVELLVFDEVDANVGGKTAGAVGAKMNQIGARRQVICITHLAPVAAAAATHFVVSKRVQEQRTISAIEKVETKARVSELTRMLGGEGEAARNHAEALLRAAKR